MNFIKNIFDKKEDNFGHSQFQKFSKGEFRNRALIKIKKTKDKYNIYLGPEFVNELVFFLAKKIGNEKILVKGAIISTSDLTGKVDFKEKKQFQGVKRYILEKLMSGKEIIDLIEKFPKSFFALSFETKDFILKTKPKAPKSGKAGKKNQNPVADFCNLKTTDNLLGESFVFENPGFKSVEINHTFLINDIIIPEELKKEGDFLKIRENAKRKGKIIRKAEIDDKEKITEIEFEV